MRQLTDTELKEFAVSLLDKQGLEQYEQFIKEHSTKLKQDCEANGFYNVPAECEDKECMDCDIAHAEQVILGCPYVDLD